MARPDLPDGFGGWQVVDATPQETSDGKNSHKKHTKKKEKHQYSDTGHIISQAFTFRVILTLYIEAQSLIRNANSSEINTELEVSNRSITMARIKHPECK